MHRVALVAVLLAVTLVAACGDDPPPAKPEPPASGGWTHVVGAGGAVYYLVGPQQAHPPEGTFPPGTKVRLLTEHGSYVRVASETGQTAYVATGSLAPLQR